MYMYLAIVYYFSSFPSISLSSSLQVIKLYGWEIPFQRIIADLRKKELKEFKYAAYIGAGLVFFWTCSPFVVSIAY